MPPKDKRAIKTLQRRLVHESSKTKQSKSSVVVHRIRIDLEENVPQTQGLTSMTPVEVESPSMSKEEGNGDGSERTLPQMSFTHTETNSKEGSQA